ncbi:MAG: chromosome segregation protein SMC [Alphaproteobacteria bacterium]|nr:chromosome segregation protein SMC [Alphaproteobacteria bacterium]
MHIRKLEICGFKSFPDRTAFHFGPGISGVVGPNGCGKSNVVDAVKWCLGEQSAKSLRGGSMQDVIFAGTQARTQMGMAEVSLTFAADGVPFPGEFAHHEEIRITRRLFRDGGGEYRINEARARLRDVQDLFLDTGANNRMYSFIEQGRIGQIISARPEQRRALIEEAAGISRYKARKLEAEQKLQTTVEHLDTAGRQADELAIRLRSLERQVKKAIRYRRLKSRVRQGEVLLGLARFAGLVADRRVLAQQMRKAEADEAGAIRAVARQEEVLTAARQELQVQEGKAGHLRDVLAELEASRRETESARQYQAREQEELGRRVGALQAEGARAEEEATQAEARHDEARRERAMVADRLAALEAELEQSRDAVRTAEQSLRERRDRIEAAKDQVLKCVQRVARERAALEGGKQRLSDLEQRKEGLRQRTEQVGTSIQAHEAAVAEAAAAEQSSAERADASRQALAAARDASEQAQLALRTHQDAVRAARAELSAAEDARSQVERQKSRLQARLESLQSLQDAHEGVDAEVRDVLRVDGVLGTLAEQLDVPQDLERALLVALGPALETVLAADDRAAAEAASAARGGRVRVLTLDGAGPPQGFAARFGGTDAGRWALGRLLADCGEAPTVVAGLEHWRSTGRPAVVVGDEPAFVSDRGEVVVGTAGSGGGQAILQRRREIAATRDEVAQAEGQLTGAEQAVATAREGVEAAQAGEARAAGAFEAGRAAVDDARNTASEAELALRMAQRERVTRERERDGEIARQQRLQQDLGSIDEQLMRAQSELTARNDVLRETVVAQDAAEQALHADQAGLAADEEAATVARDAREALAREAAGLRERHAALARAEQDASGALDGARRRAQGAVAEAERARGRIAELQEDDGKLAHRLLELQVSQEAVGVQLGEAREKVQAERSRIEALDESLRQAREAQQHATAARSGLDRQLAQVKTEIGHIRDSLEEKHQLSAAALLDRVDRMGHVVIPGDTGSRGDETGAADAPADPGEDADQPAVHDLRITAAMLEDEDAIGDAVNQLKADRAALDRLGEVNLVAQQEYEEVHERHATLEARRADLEESMRTIRQTIGKLNKTCRERFRDTFDQVDRNFREIYPSLVGGGSARLILTDEEDLLESGVDIMVQPPGKKLQALTLLSGGEMAMTAIALIFSLFKVKPSPFCLLDEVDAPLDEGNGARFNRTLQQMSELSQFIVITHNKKTMECADTLYGVTMAVPGVSRLVSVQLD